ncbi:MAG: hypothetical protein WCC27_12190 [Acidobacteriaceae bacterium]
MTLVEGKRFSNWYAVANPTIPPPIIAIFILAVACVAVKSREKHLTTRPIVPH